MTVEGVVGFTNLFLIKAWVVSYNFTPLDQKYLRHYLEIQNVYGKKKRNWTGC